MQRSVGHRPAPLSLHSCVRRLHDPMIAAAVYT
eukprot:SAG31_NODE_28910_length_403_cov_1.582237_1_plen_32_part_10